MAVTTCLGSTLPEAGTDPKLSRGTDLALRSRERAREWNLTASFAEGTTQPGIRPIARQHPGDAGAWLRCSDLPQWQRSPARKRRRRRRFIAGSGPKHPRAGLCSSVLQVEEALATCFRWPSPLLSLPARKGKPGESRGRKVTDLTEGFPRWPDRRRRRRNPASSSPCLVREVSLRRRFSVCLVARRPPLRVRSVGPRTWARSG